jgi:hypothetical protein
MEGLILLATLLLIVIAILWIILPFILLGTNKRLDSIHLSINERLYTIIELQKHTNRLLCSDDIPEKETMPVEIDDSQKKIKQMNDIKFEVLSKLRDEDPSKIGQIIIEKFGISKIDFDEVCRSLWTSKQIKGNIYYSLTKE